MQSRPSSPTLALGEPQQDTELWFEDGNVVIVAGNAAFRVHTGILSRHSEVFQGMFGVPQPALPALSDVIDGQPVVHVSDSGHNFKQLLHMLYDGAKFMPPDQPIAFSILAAVARLGHKYHIDWVLKEATRRLKSIFVPSYEDWTAKDQGRSNHLAVLPPFFPQIEVLNLIRLIGETGMLPVAIYRCCRCGVQSLFRTTARYDGTVETLDLSTLELCTNAHTKLIQRQAQLNAEVFCGGPSKSCQKMGACRAAMEAAYREVCGRPNVFLSGRLLDSCISSRILPTLKEEGKICFFCAASLVERERDGMKAVWKDLPNLTGVEVDNWN